MSEPSIYVAMPTTLQASFFTPALRDRLEAIGSVTWNESEDHPDQETFARHLEGTEICLTGWGSPRIDASVISSATALQLLAHTGGSVATYASEALYDAAVAVCSANDVMAKYVGEAVLAGILSSLRSIPAYDRRLKNGQWRGDVGMTETLHGQTLGFVGLGTVGRHLLRHLESFEVDVLVYDPYVSSAELAVYDFVETASLERALGKADIVSVHASLTPETRGMLGSEELALLSEGALLCNYARAAIFEEEPLIETLESGRIEAVLDVYHEEPLPEEATLRSLDNVTLTPHTAGSQIRAPLTAAIIDDIERFLEGEPLDHAIAREHFRRMTGSSGS